MSNFRHSKMSLPFTNVLVTLPKFPKMQTFGHKEAQQKHREALPIASGKSHHDVAAVLFVQGTV